MFQDATFEEWNLSLGALGETNGGREMVRAEASSEGGGGGFNFNYFYLWIKSNK
jgi:hypothetical protein